MTQTSPSQRTVDLSPENLKRIEKEERALFFKQWIQNPKRLGTLAPISKNLAQLAALCVDNPENVRLVEIGAGPGRLTRSLLARGIKPENIKAIELDPKLCAFTQKTLPHIDVIQGDAQYLPDILPSDWAGSVDIVFSTIPLMYLPHQVRANIMEASFNVLKKEGHILHLTYNYWSPLKGMDYTQEKIASLWGNFPPSFIWKYKKPDPMS